MFDQAAKAPVVPFFFFNSWKVFFFCISLNNRCQLHLLKCLRRPVLARGLENQHIPGPNLCKCPSQVIKDGARLHFNMWLNVFPILESCCRAAESLFESPFYVVFL